MANDDKGTVTTADGLNDHWNNPIHPSTTLDTTTTNRPDETTYTNQLVTTNSSSSSSSSFVKLMDLHPAPSTNVGTSSSSTTTLEERVEELELKLATLSRLIRFHQQPSSSAVVEPHSTLRIGPPDSPTILPPPQPPREAPIDVVPPEVEPIEEENASPSWGVVDPHHHHPDKRHRNLSLTLLFEGNEEEYNQDNSSAPPINSMTLAEREWLRPKILYRSYHRQNSHEANSDDENNNNNNHPNKAQHSIRKEVTETTAVANIHSSTPQNPRPPLTSFFPVEGDEKKKQQQQESQASSCHNESTSASIMSTTISSPPPISPTRQRDHSIDTILRNKVRTNWLNYLNSFQESAPNVDVQMEEFIKVPTALENIMGFGFWICVDSFLYMVTILPIRFVWSCLLLLLKIARGWKQPVNQNFQFHRRHVYQLIQVNILYIVYNYVLAPISIGKLYHWIQGQSMIKLYVIIAMVKVFDRLLSSLGQDCLESMYWNTVSRPRSSRMVISIVVVVVYAAIHALILFVHVETLNVSMNSADQALLTLLISGNFAEIKSTIFKKYNKAALFKITASDICE
jgi:hypothetical protein